MRRQLLKAEVLANEDGWVDDAGSVRDRFLKIRAIDGRELIVHDYPEPISEALIVGRQYQFALWATMPTPLILNPNAPTRQRPEWFHGEIVDANWRARLSGYSLAHVDLFNGTYVLVGTEIGAFLLDPPWDEPHRDDVDTSRLRVGERMSWERAKYDLLGVVTHI